MVHFSPPPAARAKIAATEKVRATLKELLGGLTPEQEERLARIAGLLRKNTLEDLEQLVKDVARAR